MTTDPDQLENSLMEEINQSLENTGYLPRIRAQLKVFALKKAQELQSAGSIAKTEQIPQKSVNDDDASMLELCRQLFTYCQLEETLNMMNTEIEQKDNQNISDKFPQIDTSSQKPGILQLVDKIAP